MRARGLDVRPTDRLVFQAWNEVVGEALARRIVPVAFREGGLTLEVESAVHLQELKNFTGEGYRQAANAKLERELVKRLVFKLRS